MKIADTSGQDVALTPRSRRRQWLIGSALVLAAGAVFAMTAGPGLLRWSQTERSVPADRIRIATVTRGDLVRDVSVQGRVVAAVSPTLYASQTGTITFLVDAGDRVVSSKILAMVDSPELTNQLAQEEANLARLGVEIERQHIQAKQKKLQNRKTVDLAQVALTAANREARRADQAYEKEAISQLDFEKAHDERRSAELAHEHAVADAALDFERLDFELKTRQLDLNRQQLLVSDLARQVDELNIRSPVDGIVGNLLVQQKTSVVRNQPVMAVVDLSRFELEAEVPESYSDDLRVGIPAEVRLGDDVAEATLVAVSPEIIGNQVTIRLRFSGQSPRGLRQNQRLTTRLLLESKSDVLMVTRGQFLESGGGRFAYVVRDRVATKQSIRVGARSLNSVEVAEGLQLGDAIVVSSTDVFENADRVSISD